MTFSRNEVKVKVWENVTLLSDGAGEWRKSTTREPSHTTKNTKISPLIIPNVQKKTWPEKNFPILIGMKICAVSLTKIEDLRVSKVYRASACRFTQHFQVH